MAHSLPGPVLYALYAFIHLIFPMSLLGKYCHYLHFTDEGTEAQRGEVDRKDDRKGKGRKNRGNGGREAGQKEDRQVYISFLNSEQPFMAFGSGWYWPRD